MTQQIPFKTAIESRGEPSKRLWLPFTGFYEHPLYQDAMAAAEDNAEFSLSNYLADFSQAYADSVNQIISDTLGADIGLSAVDYNVPKLTDMTDGISAVVDLTTIPSLDDLQAYAQGVEIDFKANLIDALKDDIDNNVSAWFDIGYKNWQPRHLEKLIAVMLQAAKHDDQSRNDPKNNLDADLFEFEQSYFNDYLAQQGLLPMLDD